MINFTNCVEELNKFSGSEKKKTLIFENKIYLVKFPDPILDKNKNISYINNSLSEYVGSNIFRLVGFETQETLLGKYKFNGVEKTVCACLDFTNDEKELYEFESIALSANPDKKIGTELEDILEILKNSKLFDYNSIQEKFWDMFIIDSIIGNTDRHNGNWGFLVNKKTKKIEFSPIYDCGSCLKENNKKINYMTFIKSRKNNECNEALKRMFNKIDIETIDSFINDISCISDVRKDFYKKIISMRYDILKKVYNELNDC